MVQRSFTPTTATTTRRIPAGLVVLGFEQRRFFCQFARPLPSRTVRPVPLQFFVDRHGTVRSVFSLLVARTQHTVGTTSQPRPPGSLLHPTPPPYLPPSYPPPKLHTPWTHTPPSPLPDIVPSPKMENFTQMPPPPPPPPYSPIPPRTPPHDTDLPPPPLSSILPSSGSLENYTQITPPPLSLIFNPPPIKWKPLRRWP